MSDEWANIAKYSHGLGDWSRGRFLIHDNGYGTLQIGICPKDNIRHVSANVFAFVSYTTREIELLSSEAALETAKKMVDGLILTNWGDCV